MVFSASQHGGNGLPSPLCYLHTAQLRVVNRALSLPSRRHPRWLVEMGKNLTRMGVSLVPGFREIGKFLMIFFLSAFLIGLEPFDVRRGSKVYSPAHMQLGIRDTEAVE